MTAYLGRPATRPTDLVTLADLAERVQVISGASAYAGDVGDGITRIYDVVHDLGTRDVVVTMYANTGAREEVDADVWHLDDNTTRLIFGAAPTADQYRVVILRAGTSSYAGGPGGTGPAGADGKPGVDGTNGRDGLDGSPGRDGIDGAPGADGSDGRDGLDGTDGQPGAPGADGRDGADGSPGADGVDGQPGAPGGDGAPGTPGANGINGRDGAPGLTGERGGAGPTGGRGPDGPPGPPAVADPMVRFLTLTKLL